MTALKTVPPECLSKFSSENLSKISSPRQDGRLPDQLRPVFIKSGVISNADGSAYIEVGNTKLICTIHGPHEINRSSDFTTAEFGSKSVFVTKFHFAPFATKIRLKRKKKDQETDEESNLGTSLTEAFLPVIRLDQYPKSQIDAFINVLEDDGAILSSALTCVSVALSDAGIEMYDILIGSSLRIIDDQMVYDPLSEEEYKLDRNCDELKPTGNVTLGLMPSLNQVSLMHQVGEIKHQMLNKVIKSLTDCCYKLHPVVQDAIVKSFKVKSKTFSQQ